MPLVAKLSKRETQIIKRIAKGKTYPEIAIALKLNVETVRSYVNRVRNKTGLRRKTQLALWAVTNL